MLSARKRKPSGSGGPSDSEAAPGDDTPGGGGDAQPEGTVAPMHPPHSKSPLVMGGIGALLIIVLIVGLGKSDAQQILLHKIFSSTHETLLHTPQQQLARSAPVTQQLLLISGKVLCGGSKSEEAQPILPPGGGAPYGPPGQYPYSSGFPSQGGGGGSRSQMSGGGSSHHASSKRMSRRQSAMSDSD